MELHDFLGLLKAKKQTICSLVVLFLLIGIILTAIQPFKYSSSLRLLVFQSTNNQTALDPYAVTRSNEYLSGVLSKITQSNSFYTRVINANFAIDQNYFGDTAKKQTKEWLKTVSVKTLGDTGIIAITAYHTDKQQAEQIARAVGHVLMTQHTNYHGLGDSVKIKLLDEPITSSYPVRPNLALNLILAIVLGLVFSLSYVYLLPEAKYDIRIFTRKQKLEAWDMPAEAVAEPIQSNELLTAESLAESLIDNTNWQEPIVEEPASNEEFGKFDNDWFDNRLNEQADKTFNPFK
ncbi:MAG: Wzz/FepE/Etk N-terminal domain-containing protein [bacterium]